MIFLSMQVELHLIVRPFSWQEITEMINAHPDSVGSLGKLLAP